MKRSRGIQYCKKNAAMETNQNMVMELNCAQISILKIGTEFF